MPALAGFGWDGSILSFPSSSRTVCACSLGADCRTSAAGLVNDAWWEIELLIVLFSPASRKEFSKDGLILAELNEVYKALLKYSLFPVWLYREFLVASPALMASKAGDQVEQLVFICLRLVFSTSRAVI